jgi:hypothetical protein
VRAITPTVEGAASTPSDVRYSISGTLLRKYRLWIDDPTFERIHTDPMKEGGDAQNGVIIWAESFRPSTSSQKAGWKSSGAEVLLAWKPLKELAPGEYCRVHIDFNYDEANMPVIHATREMQFSIPVALFHRPNCGVFNWQITLIHQTGTDAEGIPTGPPKLRVPVLVRGVGLRPG